MAPVPSPPPSDPTRKIPPIHLKCLDLSHPGAQRFFNFSSSPYALLSSSSAKVLHALYPDELISSESEASATRASPPVRSLTLHLREFEGVAHTCGSFLDSEHKEVHLSTSYLDGIQGESGRIRSEIEGVVVHELVHVFQWNGRGTCPGGVIEGIADWVRLKEGLGPPHWRRGGDSWDQGYNVTAFFLDYLSTSLSLPLLVPTLNLALRSRSWEDGALFKELLGGKDVDELWREYKEMLENVEAVGTMTGEAIPVPTHS